MGWLVGAAWQPEESYSFQQDCLEVLGMCPRSASHKPMQTNLEGLRDASLTQGCRGEVIMLELFLA